MRVSTLYLLGGHRIQLPLTPGQTEKIRAALSARSLSRDGYGSLDVEDPAVDDVISIPYSSILALDAPKKKEE